MMSHLDRDGIPLGEITDLLWADGLARDRRDTINRPPGVSNNLWASYLVAYVIKFRKSRHKKNNDVPSMTNGERTHLFAVSNQ